jgi:hypothetical protein
MDGITHVRRPSEEQRTRAIVRLCASLMGCTVFTCSDRLRFLQRYLTAPGRSPRDWRRHWRTIESQVGAKLQDKETRRQWKMQRYGRE